MMLKMFAAVGGGAALVTLGVLGLQAGAPTATTTAKSGSMNVGQTVTETTPPSAPEVAMAVPALKGNTPPEGFATTH